MRIFIMLLVVFLFSISAFGLDYKKEANVVLLEGWEPEKLSNSYSLATAELCDVKHDLGIAWAIDHWLIGNELYKSYQDPSLTCDRPYPFTVENAYFVIQTLSPCTLYVSIDIESVDKTNPDCPLPGALLTLTETYAVILPAAGLYQLETVLDTPVIVNEPYFAGFFFASYVDSLWGVSLITDSVHTTCVNYNIWDTATGYVDLANNEFYNFPGRLVFYTSGTPGGSYGGGDQPEPAATILTPEHNDYLSNEARIWVSENSGSNILDFVLFEYQDEFGWHELGRDYDGSAPLRNGTDISGTGDGWSFAWDYSSIPEGDYWVKATIHDTLGRFDADSIYIHLDPTPPNPTIVNPVAMGEVCVPFSITAESGDEDIISTRFEYKRAGNDYAIDLFHLSQTNFANNYCGPIAGAIAIKHWFDKGFVYTLREGSQYIALDTAVTRLAELMQVDPNQGVYDDKFLSGLIQYNLTHGNELRFESAFNPSYHQFRSIFQEEEKAVIFGLSGSPGIYLVASEVNGWADSEERYKAKVYDPMTGSIADIFIRDLSAGGSEMYYNGEWRPIDILFSVYGYSHEPERGLLGEDNSSANGWNIDLESAHMVQNSYYYILATMEDSRGQIETGSSLIYYSCNSEYSNGDYNGDGNTNMVDALYLIEYVYNDGPAPVGGDGRADANCNGMIDLTDVVFFLNYLFDGGQPPCY